MISERRREQKRRWAKDNRQYQRDYNKEYKKRMKNNLFFIASKRITDSNNYSRKMGYSPITCSKGRVMALMATQTTCCHCGAEGPLDIDHCHTTGKARGMLCRSCNIKDVLK